MNNNIESINPKDLTFDIHNPRVSEFGFKESTPERDIIKVLWDVMGVEEIVLSIKASGFFIHEPLIGIRHQNLNIIIEGNRRLAAVKYILFKEISDFVGSKPSLLDIPLEYLDSLKEIPVIFVNDRKEAWKYIGFKHINGPAKWGSYAKAQYISQIKNNFNIPLSVIAEQIGDTHRTVQKLYQGLQVIEQAEKLKLFDRTDITGSRLYFSHLYTGLSYEGFRDFLGLRDVSEESSDPVPPENFNNLSELLAWLFGNKKKEINSVIISQNPDLRYLEAVIKNRESLFALRSGVSLYEAFDISQPKRITFEQNLLEAKRALQKAHSYLTEGFDGKDLPLLKQAASIAKLADDLYLSMENKWKSLNEPFEKKRRHFEEE
jgi:hypothetical protein